MLQGAPGVAKRISARSAPRANDPKSAYGDDAVETLAIPLAIAPMLEPFRGRGRLGLRIERLHQLGRLSKGRNNGDGSWSLTAEDISGLQYLLPAIVTQAHTLAVRVIGLNGGTGETLGLLDLVVSPGTSNTASPELLANARAIANRANPRDDGQTRRLQEKLEQVQAELAKREEEIILLQEDASRGAGEIEDEIIEEEIAAARAIWKRELDERLATAAAELRRTRDAWQAEQDGLRREAEERAEQRLTEAHQRWQRESSAALLKAEENWRADAAAKLEAAREQWRSLESNVRNEGSGEIRRLRDECLNLQQSIAARETALAQARTALDQARAEWKRESDAALARARAEWRSGADSQLSSAEARWREQSEKALADANARRAAAERAAEDLRRKADLAIADGRENADQALRLARDEAADLRARLDGRESELHKLQTALEQAGEEWRRASESALTRAKAEWQSETNTQIAAIEARWRGQSDASLAEADARARAAETALADLRRASEAALLDLRDKSDRELRRAAEERAQLQAALKVQQADTAVARDEWKRETETALNHAKLQWHADMRAQLAAAEERWRTQTGEKLSQATKRYQTAEAALARIEMEKNDIDLALMRNVSVQLKSGSEPGQVSKPVEMFAKSDMSDIDRAFEDFYAAAGIENKIVLRGTRNWQGELSASQAKRRQSGRSGNFVRDFIIMIVLAASVIAAFPFVKPHLPREWQFRIDRAFGRLEHELGLPQIRLAVPGLSSVLPGQAP